MNLNRFRLLKRLALIAIASFFIFILFQNILLSQKKYSKSIVKNKTDIKYVYFDLGLNNGQSLENFLNISKYGGGGDFKTLLPKKVYDSNRSWIIHAYEANPLFDESLKTLKNKIPKQHKAFINNSTAAWTYDGFIEFYLDNINKKYDYWGSSLLNNHPDVIASNRVKINVSCHSIASILRLYDLDDIIVMKIDIEGAEYDLIIDFILKNVLDRIDYLAIEYHSSFTKYKSSNDILNEIIKKNNIYLLKWF